MIQIAKLISIAVKPIIYELNLFCLFKPIHLTWLHVLRNSCNYAFNTFSDRKVLFIVYLIWLNCFILYITYSVVKTTQFLYDGTKVLFLQYHYPTTSFYSMNTVEIRIVVAGEKSSGKTQLIGRAAGEGFSCQHDTGVSFNYKL